MILQLVGQRSSYRFRLMLLSDYHKLILLEGAKYMGKLNDLTGQKFGMLTVLYRAESHKQRTYWHCKCDCGNEKDVMSSNLTRELTRSCGCNIGKAISNSYTDLVGMVFGRLTVESRADNCGTARAWNCVCDCGNHYVARTNYLMSHKTTASCGCYNRERTSQRQLKDLTGQHIGRLTVAYRVANDRFGKVVWHCICDCGNETDVCADL